MYLGHDGGAFWRQHRRFFTGGWGWDLCPLISSQFMVDRCYLKAGRGLSKYFFGNVSELFYPREPWVSLLHCIAVMQLFTAAPHAPLNYPSPCDAGHPYSNTSTKAKLYEGFASFMTALPTRTHSSIICFIRLGCGKVLIEAAST